MNIIILRSHDLDTDSRVEKITTTLSSNGNEVILLGWDRSKNYKDSVSFKDILNQNVEIHKIGVKAGHGAGFKKSLLPMLKFQFNVIKYLIKNNHKYDYIHACDFDMGILAIIVSKIKKKYLIYDIFDYYVDTHKLPKIISKIIKRLETFIINKSDVTIICTEKRKEQIFPAKPKKLIIVHNAPDDRQFCQNNNVENRLLINSHKIKIVFIGGLVEDRFICEMIDVISTMHEFELYIGGYGQDSLMNYINIKCEENDNIFYLGKMRYSDVLVTTSLCDIMVAIYNPLIKNHYYAAPNKFYESLMLGKPIIMAKNTGLDEIVSKNGFGEVIDYNKDSFKNALIKLKEKRYLFNDTSEKMKDLYKSKYSWVNMEKILLNAYMEIKKG